MRVYSIGGVTMVGYGGPFPRPKGNCFGVSPKQSRKYYQIVNFGHENLEELLKRKIIEWPITIEVLRAYAHTPS